MADVYFIYMTASSRDEARRIADVLVREHLAACVNILGDMDSLYWWEGKVQAGSEVAFTAKTSTEQVDALIRRVKELHSYDCPCIVAMPIETGFAPFLEWIRAETSS